ncbi:hypothetical protein F5X98DRAFT_372850 [Xylaria grammica]|nr:hypothetical protein F5X98DRAFT_372850 [Xylaria grammica]
MTDQHSTVQHYVLLIGLDFYPRDKTTGKGPLQGCVNDIRMLKRDIVDSLENTDSWVLTASVDDASDPPRPAETQESLPTYGNVISILQTITERASKGNFVYIHFSGHGTAIMPDSEFDSVYSDHSSTGCLALVLLASNSRTNIQYLHGPELALELRKMVEKGLKVTLVLDCCQSGCVTRGQMDPSVRFLPYDPAVDAAYPPVIGSCLSSGDESMGLNDRSLSMRLNWAVNPDGYAILAACEPTEIAREITVENERHGAMSYFLHKTLKRNGHLRRKQQQVYSYLCAALKQAQVKQKPMLYGNKTLGFFDDAHCLMNAVPLSITRGVRTNLQLEAGQAHGICDEDLFELHPIMGEAIVSNPNLTPVTVKVTHARAFTSDLEVLGNVETPKPLDVTATRLTQLSLRELGRVYIDLRMPSPSVLWATALERRRSLDAYLTKETEQQTAFAFYVVISAKDPCEVRDEANRLLWTLESISYDLEAHVEYALGVVEHLAKFKLVEQLGRNLTVSASFKESFSVHLGLVNTTGERFSPGCSQLAAFDPECTHDKRIIDVNDGDKVELVVCNKEGNGGRSLKLHVYSMGSGWEIENILDADYEVVSPAGSLEGQAFVRGTTGVWRKSITMTVPGDKPQHCDDILKIFITHQSTSFVSLELPAVNALAKPYEAAKRGDTSTGRTDVPEDWAALNFYIRTHRVPRIPANNP